MNAREKVIVELMRQGKSVEEATRAADRAMPTSAPRRVVESSAEIVDGVLSPVATLAEETAGLAKRGIRGAFGLFR